MKILCFIFVVWLLLMSGCGRSPVAGGTTDTGNSRVAATIYTNDGSRVKGASVTLRSKNYLSGVSGAGMQKDLVRAKETFTDDSGYFEIDSIEKGDYFIEVNDRLFSAALLTATGPSSPDPDPSNNATKLMIDVVDKNDF